MPFWFVRKGMLEKDMLLALQKYFEVTAFKRIHYRLKEGMGYRDMFLQDIVYIECQGHILMIQKGGRKGMVSPTSGIGAEAVSKADTYVELLMAAKHHAEAE